MKLIFLIFLVIAPFHLSVTYTLLDELPKYSDRSFDPAKRGKYCCYYINTENFSKDTKLYFKAKITYGSFDGGYMHYGGNNERFSLGDELTLPNSVYRDSYSSTSAGGLYKDYTYFFIIQKPSQKYLYVAPPPPFNYDRLLSLVTVYSTNSFGISVWVWIGIGAFILIVIILSIVFYRYKRAQRLKNIDPLVAEPIALNTTPNTYVQNVNVYPSPSPYQQPPPTYY